MRKSRFTESQFVAIPKEGEAENAKLKRSYGELALENAAIKDLPPRKR